MAHSLKLMEILAHPDDESLGTGGTLVKYAAEGIETYPLVTATRGEHGWWGREADYPGPEVLGRTREAELRSAAQVLGLREVAFLDYVDGELDKAPPQEVIAQLTAHIRRIRPDVVVTFDPDGIYGHPDHIAISQLATAAIIAAADSSYADSGQPPHRVSKLYYLIFTAEDLAAYQVAFGDLVMGIDGVERRATGWPAWAISAILLDVSLDGCCDSFGDSSEFGYYSLIEGKKYGWVIEEDNNGFFTIIFEGTLEKARKYYDTLEDEFSTWDRDYDED